MIRKLDDSQVQDFDSEYVDDRRWQLIEACIERDFPDGKFTFLDIGGGNGVFADRILGKYTGSSCTVLDNSEYLLSLNKESDRKTIVCESVENLGGALAGRKYDIVFLNWLLHHLVSGSYNKTRSNMVECLTQATGLLSPRGRVSVFENLYDGLLFDAFPGYFIYRLTASRMLAPLTKRLGANTAGVGVCFLSRREWEKTVGSSGLAVASFDTDFKKNLPLHRKLMLHLKDLEVGLFWCRAGDSGAG